MAPAEGAFEASLADELRHLLLHKLYRNFSDPDNRGFADGAGFRMYSLFNKGDGFVKLLESKQAMNISAITM